MSFSDCTVAEGHTAQQAIGALGQVAGYLEQNGNDLFHGVLFPLAGETSDSGYDFKSITGFGSPQVHGQFLDTILTPEARQARANITGGLMTCDSPRIYATNVIRTSGGE